MSEKDYNDGISERLKNLESFVDSAIAGLRLATTELADRITDLKIQINPEPPEDFDALMGELDSLLADFKKSSQHWLNLPGKNTNMAKGEAYGFCSEQLKHIINKYKDKK